MELHLNKAVIDALETGGLRQIRNIQFDFSDCKALTEDKQKITGAVINAFGAVLQEKTERLASPDWCIFSTWLGDLVQGKVSSHVERLVGSAEIHVRAACNTDTLETLLARTKWIIPLNGGFPKHWILGWVDYSTSTMYIFDSIPELGSSSWAEPLLLKVVDEIRRHLKAEPVEWDTGDWNRKLISPVALQCQMDGFACGLFIMMAMRAATGESCWEEVANDKKDSFRNIVLEALSTAPIKAKPAVSDVSDTEVEVVDQKQDAPDNETCVDSISVTASGENSHETLNQSGRKRTRVDLDEDNGYDTENERRTTQRLVNPKLPRAPKKTIAQRRLALQDDEWIESVEESRVRCRGCKAWVQLTKNRSYESKNWDSHKNSCPQVTGFKRERVRRNGLKSNLAPAGVPPISAFFKGGSSKQTVSNISPVKLEPSDQKGAYTMRTVAAPTLITAFLSTSEASGTSAPPPPPPPPPSPIPCRHLTGSHYEEYILRSQTRSFGGISFRLRGRISRQLFPWKTFPRLRDENDTLESTTSPVRTPRAAMPDWGNRSTKTGDWAALEVEKMDESLRAWARWEVDFALGYVKSTRCAGTTTNKDEICDACKKVARDESFKHALRRKNAEAKLPLEEQREIFENRTKYAPKGFQVMETQSIQRKLKDPLLFDVHHLLERGKDTDCFLKLYQHARDGHLKNVDVFQDLCRVFADKIDRDTSGNPNAKYGIRYPQNYLNFMTLLRSHGPNSARHYGILAAQFPAPSSRHLRALVANTEDVLQNPYLIYENFARVKRFVDMVKYTGPVAIGSDCTKVRARLTYSTDYGGHILGSILPLDACEVDDTEDIDKIIKKVKSKKALATQVRAVLAKIPLPQYSPQVVALLPTTGGDKGDDIHAMHMKALKMASNLDLLIVSFAADGASSELAAQVMMDGELSHLPPLTYTYPLYGISLSVPVFRHTGPLVSISDPPHARKTCRNQPQHGTHTASLGIGYVVNRSLVCLYEHGGTGLVRRDIENVDKQDDGAARRLFHATALHAMTVPGNADGQDNIIRDGMHGLFVYLFIFGTLFDAWLSRTMSVKDRVLSAFRARFFLHLWRKHIIKLSVRFPDLYSVTRSFISPASFHIFNRLCDSLVQLVIVYSRIYPDQPFCPWLLGTEFVEHFFGISRMILPNFTYGEFLKMVKHIEVRQRLLLSGQFAEKRERHSAAGYIMDYDATPLSPHDKQLATVNLTDSELNVLVTLAFRETCHICKNILHIPITVPTDNSPLDLSRLGAPPPAKNSKKKSKIEADDFDSDMDSDASVEYNLDSDSEDEHDEQHDGSSLTLGESTAAAAHDTARYSALCEETENLPPVTSLQPISVKSLGITLSVDESSSDAVGALKSEFTNGSGDISIKSILGCRSRLTSGTTTRSERTVTLNPKFVAADQEREEAVHNGNELPKMSAKEASHRLRIGQELDDSLQKVQPRKDRELRWKNLAQSLQKSINAGDLPNLSAKNVNDLFPLKLGNFVIIRTSQRLYVGEILDMYKKGANGRYGSITMIGNASSLQALSLRVYLPLEMRTNDVDDDDEPDAPVFSCSSGSAHLHSYAPIDTFMYHLGPRALVPIGDQSHAKSRMVLNAAAEAHWNTFNRKSVSQKLPKLLIVVPGGKRAK
ncbi:hypothetical protein FPV67DRAFT_1632538 [Lyophyllum atratum]|nr:hypothetical protein FPV67DRAFT_1632538 [Lyophyllum atratum]